MYLQYKKKILKLCCLFIGQYTMYVLIYYICYSIHIYYIQVYIVNARTYQHMICKYFFLFCGVFFTFWGRDNTRVLMQGLMLARQAL
jgi:hypothetical protein